MRGFFLGLLYGTLAVVAAAVVMSLLAPPPPAPQVSSDPTSVSAPATDGEDATDRSVGRDGDVVEIAPTAPSTEAGTDDLAALQDSDTTPAARPSVSEAGDGLTQPGDGGDSPDVATLDPDAVPAQSASTPSQPATTDSEPQAGETPQRPSVGGATAGLEAPAGSGSAPDVSAIATRPPAAAPGGDLTAPDADSGSISVDPAQPAPPVVGDETTQLSGAPDSGQAPEVAPATDPTVASGTGEVIAQPGGQDQPATPSDPAPAAGTAAEATAPQQPEDDGEEPAPQLAGGEDPAVASATSGAAPATPAPAPAQPPTPETAEPPAPRIAALPQASGNTGPEAGPEADPDADQDTGPDTGPETGQESGPAIGTRVRPLTERGQKNTFLPASGTEDAAPADVPAIRRYAAAFDNPEGKPLMSIVLIDDEGSIGAEALQEFPYPLTFAVSPGDPEAIDKLARYRKAGFEVALLTDLPAAANAQDAEVSLGAALAALPETVAILEGTGSGIQGNRALSGQVAAIALATGRGLVTQRNGLNTAQKLAAREGVPSAVVFRDFDGAGQSPDTMRRFLDQAAFRADQEGAVVMLGRVRPDTISALLLWGLQDRASRVALAPLSAALLREPAN